MMQLPLRVRIAGHGWARFISCLVLNTAISLAILIVPPVSLYSYLLPQTFYERLLTVVLTVLVTVLAGVCAVVSWIWSVSKTTNW